MNYREQHQQGKTQKLLLNVFQRGRFKKRRSAAGTRDEIYFITKIIDIQQQKLHGLYPYHHYLV
ncbi:hypothetical protein KY290_031025 [Solanum tuberosum]|uniref:Uncharacterized protein n=1 Tax=Solanum tuberosum TaxID=4113 RepID=A0ABQ7U7Z2_SOLTU|nr:hypothetical protein KY290_031025 [Solanum tuberosum]